MPVVGQKSVVTQIIVFSFNPNRFCSSLLCFTYLMVSLSLQKKMARRNKLQKFSEILSFPNVLENYEYNDIKLVGKDGVEVNMRGLWAAQQFKNNHPITLELACGRGEYTLGLAHRYPERNFIGMDIKGARIWRGAKDALDQNLHNIAYLRSRIEQVEHFFEEGEIDEIWITFPDPFLREAKSNRRLTSPPFLARYRKILKKGGIIHLKTDNTLLYEYTLEVLADEKDVQILTQNNDIYDGVLPHPDLDIKTYYEKMHLKNNLTIKYVAFRLGI